MSVKAKSRVERITAQIVTNAPSLPRATILVALVMAERLDAGEVTAPPIRWIVKRTRLSVSSVYRAQYQIRAMYNAMSLLLDMEPIDYQ